MTFTYLIILKHITVASGVFTFYWFLVCYAVSMALGEMCCQAFLLMMAHFTVFLGYAVRLYLLVRYCEWDVHVFSEISGSCTHGYEDLSGVLDMWWDSLPWCEGVNHRNGQFCQTAECSIRADSYLTDVFLLWPPCMFDTFVNILAFMSVPEKHFPYRIHRWAVNIHKFIVQFDSHIGYEVCFW